MTAEIRVNQIKSRSGINTVDFTNNGFFFPSNVGVGTTVSDGAADPNNTTVLNVGIVTANFLYASQLFGDATGLTGTPNIVVGIITANEFSGSGDNLIFSPTITSFNPSDGSTGVSALTSPTIILTYDQPIAFGTGKTIAVREGSAAGTIATSYVVGVLTQTSISNQTLTLDFDNPLDYDQEYYVVLPQGSVVNNVGGNSALLDTYNFTTEAAPTLSSVNPGFAETNVGFDTNFTFTFNKSVRAGVGTITLRREAADGEIIESYDVQTSDRLTFDTSNLIIDPTANLGIGTTVFVVIPDNAVGGYAGTNTYSIETLNFAFDSIVPANSATNVDIASSIALTFTGSPPTRRTGTVQIRSGSVSGSLVESFDAAASGQISISGNTWYLAPSSDLAITTEFFTIIPSTAINFYVGLNTTGADSHSFTTRDLALGDSYEGGVLICQSGGIRWVVSPDSAEVSRSWYSRNDSNTRAQQVSGCTGWFVPTCSQIQNPFYSCRTYWNYSPTKYWSATQRTQDTAWYMDFNNGTLNNANNGKPDSNCVRSLRCVSY